MRACARMLPLIMLLVMTAACASAQEWAYGGRGEDRLLGMTAAGRGLFVVGMTDSTDGDLSMRTREGDTGWAMLLSETGERMWSYSSAHTGFERMISPAALEDERYSLVLTNAAGQQGEWLLLGGDGSLLKRMAIPKALCGEGKAYDVCQYLLCSERPAELAVIAAHPREGTLCAARISENGSVQQSSPFLADAQGCAASDGHGNLAWMGTLDGQLTVTRLDADGATETMSVAFADYAVKQVNDAFMQDDSSVICCGEAEIQGKSAGFIVRVSLSGDILFAHTAQAPQRFVSPTENGFAAYGETAQQASVCFMDEDGRLLGEVEGMPAGALDLSAMAGGAAVLTHEEGKRQPQTVVTQAAQPQSGETVNALPEETQIQALTQTLYTQDGCVLLCEGDARGVQVTCLQSDGREMWSTRIPIHTAADMLMWQCALRLEDGRVLLGGCYLTVQENGTLSEAVTALLGGDGVLRSISTVQGAQSVLEAVQDADGRVQLTVEENGRSRLQTYEENQ